MAQTPATGTCIAFSATLSAAKDDNATTGYPSLTWVGASELRTVGDLGGERAITSNTNLCTGLIEKSAGSIDNGTQEIVLAFDYDEVGQSLLHTAYKANAVIACRETLTSGDVFYYDSLVPKSMLSTTDGDEVKWMGTLAITGGIVEVAA